MKLPVLIKSQTSTAELKFGNGKVISSHKLWLSYFPNYISSLTVKPLGWSAVSNLGHISDVSLGFAFGLWRIKSKLKLRHFCSHRRNNKSIAEWVYGSEHVFYWSVIMVNQPQNMINLFNEYVNFYTQARVSKKPELSGRLIGSIYLSNAFYLIGAWEIWMEFLIK